MKLVIAVFGKPGSPFVKDEVEKYSKRLRFSNVQIEVVELRSSKREDRAKSLAEEAVEFSKRFPKEDFQWIVLAEEGKLMNTFGLSSWIKPRLASNCVFLIGSAYGIAPEIKKQANLLLSLSSLTFTHDHARVLLTEQLYRCLMIIAGHPYHHV